MRTTVTLDPDVMRLIEDAMHRERRPRRHVINDAIRKALRHPAQAPAEPYRVVAHESSLRPGFDRTGFNRLADELEDEAIMDKARRTS